jgi:hypothetical protein
VHTEDDPVRAAAELVANRRKAVVESRPIVPTDVPEPVADTSGATPGYQAFRHRRGKNRPTPPGSKRATSTSTESAAS